MQVSNAVTQATIHAGPSPARIFDTLLYGRMRADALVAGIELEIFTAIAEGKTTSSELAQRSGASERGVTALCNFLVAAGFLTKGSRSYGLTDDSRVFLDKRSPAYCGATANFFSSPHMIERSANTTASVRRGGPESNTSLEPNAALWRTFAESMVPVVAPAAVQIAKRLGVANSGPLRVLDIAAGHGEYGLAIARENPLALVTALDWPNIVEVAAQRAHAAGLGERFRTLPGSAFAIDFAGPYELALLPNFLHSFSERDCVALLTKIRAALLPEGRLAIAEFVPNDDRVSPPWPAMFDLAMLLEFPGGRTYTKAELNAMLETAGFGRIASFPLEPTPQTLVVAIAD